MVDDVWMENARVLKNTVMQKTDVELVRILCKYTNIISFITKKLTVEEKKEKKNKNNVHSLNDFIIQFKIRNNRKNVMLMKEIFCMNMQ